MKLDWQLVTGSTDPKFWVKGTTLYKALIPLAHFRFAIHEVRCYDAQRQADRRYGVADASLCRTGERAPVVFWADDEIACLKWISRTLMAERKRSINTYAA